MSIVPSGKRKNMVTQSSPLEMRDGCGLYLGTLSPGQIDILNKISQVAPMDPQQQAGQSQPMDAPQDPAMEGAEQAELPAAEVSEDPTQQQDPTAQDPSAQPQEENGKPSLSKLIFDFLTGMGYEPRRLQEFKNSFYDERGSKGGDTQVTITLPDQMYGTDQPLPKEGLKQLVDTIEQTFGLSFVDYSRANLKVVLNFSSMDPKAQQMDEGPGDVLDQVYGRPGGSSGRKKGKSTNASTIGDMIKSSKSDLVNSLLSILSKEKS